MLVYSMIAPDQTRKDSIVDQFKKRNKKIIKYCRQSHRDSGNPDSDTVSCHKRSRDCPD